MVLAILLTATASFGAALAFGFVGASLMARPYSKEHRLVGFSFVLWWLMFGLESFTDGSRVLLAAFGVLDPWIHLFLMRVKIVAAAVAIWGLGHYVIFLWTGRSSAAAPIGVFATLHAAVFLFLLQRRLPLVVEAGKWSTRTLLQNPSLTPMTQGIGTALFFLPPIVLGVAYLALLPRLSSRTLRARVVAIASVILVFHAASIVQFNPSRSADTPISAVFSAVAVLAAATALLVYHPPAWMQRRFGLESVRKESLNSSPAQGTH